MEEEKELTDQYSGAINHDNYLDIVDIFSIVNGREKEQQERAKPTEPPARDSDTPYKEQCSYAEYLLGYINRYQVDSTSSQNNQTLLSPVQVKRKENERSEQGREFVYHFTQQGNQKALNLSMKDLQCLAPKTYLNDSIINFFL